MTLQIARPVSSPPMIATIAAVVLLLPQRFAAAQNEVDPTVPAKRIAAQQPITEQSSTETDRPVDAMDLTARAFRAAARKIQPTLVLLDSFGGVRAKQGVIDGIRKQGEGNTTGVVVSADGYILTSTFNFIQQASVVTVTTFDGQKRVARILGRDDTRKICLLKIDDVTNLTVPDLLPVEQVQVGQWAISLGVGYGDRTPAISMGIISAKNRIGGRAIQTDANISPANYGGPLVDIEGRMIGICVPMNPQSQAVTAGVEWYDSGIGFAVPVDDFAAIVQQLKDGRQIKPAFLGLRIAARSDGLGMKVFEVVPKAAADRAGVRKGDVLIAIDGEPINDMLRLRQVLNRFAAGDPIELKYQPAGDPDAPDPPLESRLIELGPPPAPENPGVNIKPPEIR